jgi:glycosyltransferase involved in cell wall biosynthesis
VDPAAAARVRPVADLPQHRLHDELARRRAYLHTARWTSLGLSLIEAMALGMPVVVLDTTEASEAVPDDVGVRSTDPARLRTGLRELLADPAAAAAAGTRARAVALDRYGMDRFLADWDALLHEAAPVPARRPTPAGPSAPVPARS